MRRIEERVELPNGIKGEWEFIKCHASPNEARQIVAVLNQKAKEEGTYRRYRSVDESEA